MKWEYLALDAWCQNGANALQPRLDFCAKDGWELMMAVPVTPLWPIPILIFKRPFKEPEAT